MAKIIIIDDDEGLRNTLARVLKGAGHTVATAINGYQGVQLFRAESADLIITDIMMPYGGLPTIRVLRDENPTLKIIAMSGAGQAHLDVAGTLGADRTLNKPFLPRELIEAVNGALGLASPQAGPPAQQ
jgi:DNA-binding response OmpR family regulator